jgi:hypothetical protein
VDGRETSYFEWLHAGLYSADLQESAMHGRTHHLHELRYGFDRDTLFLRVDWISSALTELRECEFHLRVKAGIDVVVIVEVQAGKITSHSVEQAGMCLLAGKEKAHAALGSILEVSLPRELVPLAGKNSMEIGVALWHGGLPVDVLPAQGTLSVALGEDSFAW